MSIALAALVLLMTACADPDAVGTAPTPTATAAPPTETLPPDTPVSDQASPPAAPGDEPPAGEPTTVEPQDATNVQPRPFQAAEETQPGVLRVTYWSGVEPCYALGEVQVEETDTTVTVTLLEGQAAGVPTDELVCIEIAQRYATDVDLDAPLGDREVIDGATDRPPPGTGEVPDVAAGGGAAGTQPDAITAATELAATTVGADLSSVTFDPTTTRCGPTDEVLGHTVTAHASGATTDPAAIATTWEAAGLTVTEVTDTAVQAAGAVTDGAPVTLAATTSADGTTVTVTVEIAPAFSFEGSVAPAPGPICG